MMEDLYDFAYGSRGRAQQAAIVQAGHATLSVPTEPTGKIFFTRVLFDTGRRTVSETYSK